MNALYLSTATHLPATDVVTTLLGTHHPGVLSTTEPAYNGLTQQQPAQANPPDGHEQGLESPGNMAPSS